MHLQLKMCFKFKSKKKNVLIRVKFFFNKNNIDVFFEHLRASSIVKKFFLMIVMKMKVMQNKLNNEKIAKKKKNEKRATIKKKIIAKHICKDRRCFNYFSKNVCYVKKDKH